MNFLKRTIRICLSAFVMYFLLYGGYVFFASAEKYSFEYPLAGYIAVKGTYHEAMTDYFKEKVKLLMETPMDNPDYSPPPKGEECSEKNVSTYCVAIGALDRYAAYVKTLAKVNAPILGSVGSSSAGTDANPVMPVVGNPLRTVTDVFGAVTEVDQAVAEEIKNAQNVTDTAIGIYNELRLAYPMHKKYEEITVDLYNYRDFLADIRIQTERFPVKFIDSTSQSCE